MLTNKMRLIIKSDNKRNRLLHKNIIASAIIKIAGLCSSLLVVPITLNYLNSEIYGIWLVILSILQWITLFDIGLGNGTRNYLTQAISTKNYSLGQSYLSTTLILLLGIAIVICCITIAIIYKINLNTFFNTNIIGNEDLQNIMSIAVAFTFIQFILKNVGLIYVALQKYAIYYLLLNLGNIISFVIIYILSLFTVGNLTYVIITYTISPIIVFTAALFPTFIKNPLLRPNIKSVDLRLSKHIVSKGLGFFIIQICNNVILFGSSNIFVAQFCSINNVTVYNISLKYFYLLVTAYTIILSPLWNAYTDAYVKNDITWIIQTLKKTIKIWGFSVVCGLIMLIFCNFFYKIWIGSAIHIPFSVSASILIYVCALNINCCFTYLLNGLNKISVQIITSLSISLIYIITISFWGKKLNIEGIVIGMAISFAIMSIIHIYQCSLILKKRAKGIWDK